MCYIRRFLAALATHLTLFPRTVLGNPQRPPTYPNATAVSATHASQPRFRNSRARQRISRMRSYENLYLTIPAHASRRSISAFSAVRAVRRTIRRTAVSGRGARGIVDTSVGSARAWAKEMKASSALGRSSA